MKRAQATAITDLIRSMEELHGRTYLNGSDECGWYVKYEFIDRDGESHYDIIATPGDLFRWLGSRGKAALFE